MLGPGITIFGVSRVYLKVMKFKVQETNSGQRLDEVILDRAKNSESQFSEINRSQIKKLISGGFAKLNNQVVTKSGTKLKNGDSVQLELPKSNFVEFDLPIIFEDENTVVYNKPSGMLTHAKGGFTAENTLSLVLEPKTTDLGGERTGIVHRLDRDTSGVIICAKNPEAKSYLMRQFSERRTKKTYLAVIESVPKLSTAKLDWPIGRNPKNPSFFRVSPEGKPAQTIYQVISSTDNLSLVKLNPITGRTHQLRVHMLHLNHPIIGDRFYNVDSKIKSPRLMLHALSLEITIPGGIRKVFRADPPPEFLDFLSEHTLSLED